MDMVEENFFLDQLYGSWIHNPVNAINPEEPYFNGNLIQRIAFFDQARKDIREFLKDNCII